MGVPSRAGLAVGGGWVSSAVQSKAYRADIDGLRALAVLAVVVGHFWPAALPGGYVGVDVFFVISGYLITQILVSEIAQGRFRLAGFYGRRARRLLPALCVVLAATLVVSSLVMLPGDMAAMLRALLATVLFSANLLFWRDSTSYFGATESMDNPLLHLWSLGVEEQFYVVFPWLLVAVFAWARRLGRDPVHVLRWALLGLAALGLLVAGAVADRNSTAAFYLSPLRAWEFTLGAIAAVWPARMLRSALSRQVLATASLGVLLACLVFYSPHTRFPGWAALPPVLATAWLLHTGATGHVVARLLATPALVGVGLVSYSLYLWHWPVLVLARHYQGPTASPGWLVLWLALAVLLAVLTWRFVEQPWRRPVAARPANGRAWAIAAAASGVLVAIWGLHLQGLAWRVPASVRALDDARDNERIPLKACADRPVAQACVLGEPAVSPQVLLWGDSHMLAWAPALDRLLADARRSARLTIHLACAPLRDLSNTQVPRCAEAGQDVWAHVRAHPEIRTVVLAAHWSHYFRPTSPSVVRDAQGRRLQGLPAAQLALQITLKQLLASGREVVLIGPVPTYGFSVPQALAHQVWHQRPVAVSDAAYHSARHQAFWDTVQALGPFVRLRVLDPVAWMCRPQCVLKDQGQSLYRDEQHLNAHGARWTEPWLAQELGWGSPLAQP